MKFYFFKKFFENQEKIPNDFLEKNYYMYAFYYIF